MDYVPHNLSMMGPKVEAIDAYNWLAEMYDTYFLASAPGNNPSAWSDKLEWVKQYLGEVAYKRLILSHHKDLCVGDYLVDDRVENGAKEFKGEHIHFGKERFPDWDSVVKYLMK